MATYYAVLLLTVGVALARGGPLEKWAALTALVASVSTTIVSPAPQWTHVEVNIFAIDLIALASFWLIALKTRRFWPYWITGWQLIAIFGHLQKLMFVEILARPYALLSMYISYPILFVILYASGSSGRRSDARA
ncbi:hypothetical protein [Sphingopyxis indica]|uniref:hypothetical protein n=1 Tax=Sphingopyxis indica TaxID=436663 RepID=UPI0029391D55|nr:hypothetical protein [Sphingopyxis indica]